VLASSALGLTTGFLAGLVPGLHMNNIAAALTAYASAAVALFGWMALDSVGVLAACFISAAMVAHMFAEAITSTYVGIPSEDVVSVLPAHRLARSGLGQLAVRTSADGVLVGVVLSVAAFPVVCYVMGDGLGLYSLLREFMVIPLVVFSMLLVLSEGMPSLKPWLRHRDFAARVVRGAAIFLASGVLGVLVLKTNFYSCPVPDFPWIAEPFVPKSSLLLPMFAGLFGIPGLLLSIGARSGPAIASLQGISATSTNTSRSAALTVLGGILVGWFPGMTSGSATTVCSPTVRDAAGDGELKESLRFISLYSSISASGAVFSVGALFVISRARSGCMDAAGFFLGDELLSEAWVANTGPIASILLAMSFAALISSLVVRRLEGRLMLASRLLCSKHVALASMAFVVALSAALTGVRGSLLMATAVFLGLIPPLSGVRRIQLMGCLLVPIALTLI
jgi:putative membrane protein